MDQQQFNSLLEKWLSGRLHGEEHDLFWHALSEAEKQEWISRAFYRDLVDGRYSGLSSAAQQAAALAKLEQAIDSRDSSAKPGPVWLRSAWFRAAAVVIMAVGIYSWWKAGSVDKVEITSSVPSTGIPADIEPGRPKATLTLADGTLIPLDDVEQGLLARQQGITIEKPDKGRLVYKISNRDSPGASTVLQYNTITTPKGGQYQLTLSDGSQVWLNSASSIRIPAAFSENQRVVEMTGEVYFEVTNDKNRPFTVMVNGENRIEVLGTKFNVNAYDNEPAIEATLLEGSVKVANAQQNRLLVPGQQARMKAATIELIREADIEKVMAWKNGFFNFEEASLREVMNQLERWYDIEVEYEPNIPDIRFGGEMSRNVPLSDLLKGLKEMHIDFQIKEGRKLMIKSR